MTAADAPLVMIEWLDSVQPAPRWQHLADYEPGKAMSCVSVGWLIQDDDEAKAIAPNVAGLDDEAQVQASGVIVIPSAAVTRIVRLREAGDPIEASAAPSSRPARARKRIPA